MPAPTNAPTTIQSGPVTSCTDGPYPAFQETSRAARARRSGPPKLRKLEPMMLLKTRL